MTNELVEKARTTARQWLAAPFDPETQKQVKHMLDHDEQQLVDSFYTMLEFGTGGLRGIMGPRTNRMNIYTVGMATQGLCNYLLKQFSHLKQISVAITYDSRNNSKLFAETAAGVFAANGIRVYLSQALRPTPWLSFAVRYFNCQSGVVITASHNPKEYNGYKAYWDDGAQVVPPHDKNIIAEVKKITAVSDVKFNGPGELITLAGSDVDEVYLRKITGLSLSPDINKKFHDLKIVYTSIHGTGITLVPEALLRYGFTNVTIVAQQDIPDGNFPTVHSPNPEEASALALGLETARKIDADILLATDPDSDRVGIAIKNDKKEFILMNGNQTGALLIYYLLKRRDELKMNKPNDFIVKTIVTTRLIEEIGKSFGVRCFNVLTGFKYIAEIIRENEGTLNFVGGGEESYGYLVGDFVRDKDAVSACALIAEAASWARSIGKTVYQLLMDIYLQYGMFKEGIVNIGKKGVQGQQEIQQMMENYRNAPPERINQSEVMLIHDFEKRQTIDMISNLRYEIHLPASNVLQFILKDGSIITVRPSGTEPKIKFYFAVSERVESAADLEETNRLLDHRIDSIKQSLRLI